MNGFRLSPNKTRSGPATGLTQILDPECFLKETDLETFKCETLQTIKSSLTLSTMHSFKSLFFLWSSPSPQTPPPPPGDTEGSWVTGRTLLLLKGAPPSSLNLSLNKCLIFFFFLTSAELFCRKQSPAPVQLRTWVLWSIPQLLDTTQGKYELSMNK